VERGALVERSDVMTMLARINCREWVSHLTQALPEASDAPRSPYHAAVPATPPLRSLPWYVEPGSSPKLGQIDAESAPDAPGDRAATEAATAELQKKLADLQNRLRAEESRSVLLVLQAMDAGGKDGTVKNVFRGVNPMGLHIVGFDVPNDDELARDFLWRVHAQVPPRGMIGIFNRSHYEDILAVRVRKLRPPKLWQTRYDSIRDFEAMLTREGTTILKVMLHISKDEQARRLQERIDDPTKQWKFRLGDLDDRKLWNDYQRAYEDVLARTSTEDSPWFVVPADKKWYRNWAVATIVTTALERMNPQFPRRSDLAGVVVEGLRPKKTSGSSGNGAAGGNGNGTD
jgi:PPK2 family polyphosphate:nucleotide phosphotransferase